MSYTSKNQLEERYGTQMLRQLTDRSVPAIGQIDDSVIARALTDTDAELDGYIAVRYKLPLVTTPRMLAEIAERVAIYKLHRSDPNQKIVNDYNLAIEQLGKIAKGQMVLDVQGAEPAASTSAVGTRSVSSGRDFDANTLTYLPGSLGY